MKTKPRGILVVHDDLSERVARLVVGELAGKGKPVTRRNIRYDYFPAMYELVISVGVECQKNEGRILTYSYVPYSEYLKESDGALSRDEYHAMYAERISGKLIESMGTP